MAEILKFTPREGREQSTHQIPLSTDRLREIISGDSVNYFNPVVQRRKSLAFKIAELENIDSALGNGSEFVNLEIIRLKRELKQIQDSARESIMTLEGNLILISHNSIDGKEYIHVIGIASPYRNNEYHDEPSIITPIKPNDIFTRKLQKTYPRLPIIYFDGKNATPEV